MAKALRTKDLKDHQARLSRHADAVTQSPIEQARALLKKTPIDKMNDQQLRAYLLLLSQHLGIV